MGEEELAKHVKTHTPGQASADADDQGPIPGMPKESNISKKLTEKTTKIVIILILSTLFILPFMELTTYINAVSSFEIGFTTLLKMYGQAKDPSI
jgi:hypothetical protein